MAEWSRATAILSLHKPCIAFSVLGPPATHLHGCTADMGMGKRRKCQPAMSHGKKLRARNAAASGCMCFASSARLAASPAKRCLFFPLRAPYPWAGEPFRSREPGGRWSIPSFDSICPVSHEKLWLDIQRGVTGLQQKRSLHFLTLNYQSA